MTTYRWPRTLVILACTVFAAVAVSAGDIRVMTSGAFTAAYLELSEQFEGVTRDTIITAATSMGTGADSIPSRIQRGEDVDVVVGTGTTIIAGEGLIATAGAIDTHVHLLSPRVVEAELASGVTTVISQEFGPVWGPGISTPWALRHAFNSFDAWPINIGFLGRGSTSSRASLEEAVVEGGVCGFKVHEDIGAHARALDTAELAHATIAEKRRPARARWSAPKRGPKRPTAR